MIGITPAWLTFKGRNCFVPPKTRRPRTCLADWVGIRRWLSVIAITPTTTAMNKPEQQQDRDDAVFARLGAQLRGGVVPQPIRCATGSRARMPAMIKRLIPLPMPYSSICSPTHIRKIVPAVMMQTQTNPFQKSRDIWATPHSSVGSSCTAPRRRSGSRRARPWRSGCIR